MLVPKAPMNQYRLFVGAPDYVGLSRQFLGVKTKTVSETMNERANNPFRFHALGPDSAHIFRAPLLVQLIHASRDVAFSA
jgi:hypothetical protein